MLLPRQANWFRQRFTHSHSFSLSLSPFAWSVNLIWLTSSRNSQPCTIYIWLASIRFCFEASESTIAEHFCCVIQLCRLTSNSRLNDNTWLLQGMVCLFRIIVDWFRMKMGNGNRQLTASISRCEFLTHSTIYWEKYHWWHIWTMHWCPLDFYAMN